MNSLSSSRHILLPWGFSSLISYSQRFIHFMCFVSFRFRFCTVFHIDFLCFVCESSPNARSRIVFCISTVCMCAHYVSVFIVKWLKSKSGACYLKEELFLLSLDDRRLFENEKKKSVDSNFICNAKQKQNENDVKLKQQLWKFIANCFNLYFIYEIKCFIHFYEF